MADFERYRFPSGDGIHEITAHLCLPAGEVRAVILAVHGLFDFTLRYRKLALSLCKEGFAFAGADMLGHGDTAGHSADLGFFAEEDGGDTVVTDVHKMTLTLKAKFPDTPILLLGVGSGCVFARNAVKNYGKDYEGLMLLGPYDPPSPSLLQKIAEKDAGRHGDRIPSPFVEKRLFGGKNACFDKEDKNGVAWYSRNQEEVKDLLQNPRRNFRMSALGLADYLSVAKRVKPLSFAKYVSRNLPIWIGAGECDVLGRMGRAPADLARRLRENRVKDTTIRLYPGMRHDLISDQDFPLLLGELKTWLTDRF